MSHQRGDADRIRQRIDIVDVAAEHVTLKPWGSKFRGLCPLHGEKTPSFTVSREKQSLHCFGCGAKGDVLEFVMRHDGLDANQATETLAMRVDPAHPVSPDRPQGVPPGMDPFDLRNLYKHLRVVDVCDAMDGIGYFDLGLMDPDVRPLWPGMKFWGVALTIRCVPANRPMWKLDTTEDIVNAHGLWFKEVGHVGTGGLIEPGHVIITDTGGSREVGFWGSANSLGAMADGAVGIVTDGYCRDTYEVALQKTPLCARKRGRTIIPGRIEVVETQVRVGCGGVQVEPGDMVGCDDDGVVVVPQRIAEEVAVHARAILLADMRARRKHYERLGMEPDETVDFESVERYYADLN